MKRLSPEMNDALEISAQLFDLLDLITDEGTNNTTDVIGDPLIKLSRDLARKLTNLIYNETEKCKA